MYLDKHKHLNYLLFIIALLLFWTCSSKFSYDARSFLFDGVPNSYEVEVSVVEDSLHAIDSTSVNEILVMPLVRNEFILHTPYGKRECTTCHDRNSMGGAKLSLPDLCNQCHEDYNKTYKILHGPVASGACTQCHNPHQSKLKNLLVRQEPELCLNCHTTTMVLTDKSHAGIDDVSSCSNCHNPHGGSNDTFLLTK